MRYIAKHVKLIEIMTRVRIGFNVLSSTLNCLKLIMKLLKRYMNKDKSGSIIIIPECDDDILCLHNIITQGDLVTANSSRKVTNKSNTGSSLQFKINLKLTLRVETVNYYPGDSTIRVKGKNVHENEHVHIGQYHSHDLIIDKKISIHKELWDSYYLDCVEDACDVVKTSDVAAILIQEGIANIFLINKCSTILKAKIKQNIPRKRSGYLDVRERV
uniref:Protein pelota (Trinotate prediction) n=1 Tax=Henneguya salminicola TaxID=69463 RepID=A0A6G3MFU1_HENSL